MKSFEFETVDVFTTARFGGNPLAVFPEAQGLGPARMQALAAELNLSETTFVFPPADPVNTARVRIFNRTAEMAFAGHPSIGTAFVLARRASAPRSMRFEMPAGVTTVDLDFDADGRPVGGVVRAPQPLSTGEAVPTADVAACIGLGEEDIRTGAHRPLFATMGNPYVLVEVERDALSRCEPDRGAFRRALAARGGEQERFSIFAYSRDGATVRARMFAPLAGTWEDPATGSANAPLAGLLLSIDGGERLAVTVTQGVEMGRPSRLELEAWREGGAIYAKVGGSCVPMFSGRFEDRMDD